MIVDTSEASLVYVGTTNWVDSVEIRWNVLGKDDILIDEAVNFKVS